MARVRPSERPFYIGVSAAFLALVVWTFARTYYLKAWFGTPALTPLVHVHGVFMSGWVLLLAVQSGLVAAHRTHWHRQLGVFGTAWGIAVVIVGTITTVHAAAREVGIHASDASQQVMITGVEMLQMGLFAAFLAAAIHLRRRPDHHKRYMLMTAMCMLPSALGRLPLPGVTNELILVMLDAALIALIGIDSLRYRRIHPALALSGAAFFIVINGGLLLAETSAWIGLGSRLAARIPY